jgi:hypothetical protein
MNQPDTHELLMGEVVSAANHHGGDYVEAWREVLHRPRSKTILAFERNTRAENRAVVEMSDARMIPGTSVQKARPSRGAAAGLQQGDTTQKPGESFTAFQLRAKNQLDRIQQTARPASSGGGKETFSERERDLASREAAYQKMKRDQLNDSAGAITRMAEATPKPTNSTKADNEALAKALVVMRSKQQRIFGSELSRQKDEVKREYGQNLKDALDQVARESR